MPRHTRLATGLVTATALAVLLGGCNAARDQLSGPPRDENDVPITRLVKDAVTEALPDAVEVTPRAGLDGFAYRMGLTVTWPDEEPLDAAAVAAGARAICEHLTGFDYVDYGFYRPGEGRRVDLTELWPSAFPDVGRVDGSTVVLLDDDCTTVLG